MKIKISRQNLELKCLRIINEAKPATQCLDLDLKFRIKHPSVLTPEAIHLLLNLNPIFVVPMPRNNLYKVIYGHRLFELASHTLNPSNTIAVNVINNKLSEEDVDLLNYVDTIVVPTVESLDISYSEQYELITSEQRFVSTVWSVDSKAGFARAFETSRSQLSQHKKKELIP